MGRKKVNHLQRGQLIPGEWVSSSGESRTEEGHMWNTRK